MKITNDLLRETAIYIEHYMNVNESPSLVYHNLSHTLYVVRACDIISMNTELDNQERMTIQLAAWFHDIGYFTNPSEHEIIGVKMAAVYFREKGLDEDVISEIENCILATRMPQQPTSLMAQVICDADLQHLGSEEESIWSALLRQEMAILKNVSFTDEEWIRFNIDFLKKHHYFTEFARMEFGNQKLKNIVLLEQKLDDLIKQT